MKPKVLHIYKDYYPPVVGGIENSINLICQGVKDAYDVTVLVANTKPQTDYEEIDGIKVIKALSFGRIASAPLCPTFPMLLNKHAGDILHFHVPNPTGDLSYLLTKPPGKAVVTYHSDVVRQKWAMGVYGIFLRRFLRKVTTIMPTSPNYIDSSPFLHEVRDKCHVVPLGIDLSSFRLTPKIEASAQKIKMKYGSPIVIFVGKLRYYKGLDFLLEAMKHIDAHLLIIGDGPEKEHLKKVRQPSPAKEKIHLLGEISDEEKVVHLHAADVFCLPSHLRSEAFGICQIEAMACGVPVVSTALDTGVPFVNQHEQTGLIVPPHDPGALAKAITTLLSNHELRSSMGNAAKKRAESVFSSDKMVDFIKDIYGSILD